MDPLLFKEKYLKKRHKIKSNKSDENFFYKNKYIFIQMKRNI